MHVQYRGVFKKGVANCARHDDNRPGLFSPLGEAINVEFGNRARFTDVFQSLSRWSKLNCRFSRLARSAVEWLVQITNDRTAMMPIIRSTFVI